MRVINIELTTSDVPNHPITTIFVPDDTDDFNMVMLVLTHPCLINCCAAAAVVAAGTARAQPTDIQPSAKTCRDAPR